MIEIAIRDIISQILKLGYLFSGTIFCYNFRADMVLSRKSYYTGFNCYCVHLRLLGWKGESKWKVGGNRSFE